MMRWKTIRIGLQATRRTLRALGRREDGAPSATALRASLAQTGVTPRHATDLLIAFRQDAVKSRYATIDELYSYCHYSAVPVGRYVLSPGNATVLVMSDALKNADARPELWLAKDFFKAERIKSLATEAVSSAMSGK